METPPKQHWTHNHKLHWIALGACITLLIAGMVWYGLGYITFRQETAKLKNTIMPALSQTASKLRGNTDANTAIAALDNLATQLVKPSASTSNPTLSNDQRKDLHAINIAVAEVTTAIKEQGAYLSYQQTLAKTLGTLSSLQAKDQAQLNALASTWQAAATTTNKQVPPPAASNLHDSITAAVQAGSDTAATLAATYQKMDATTYAIKKQAMLEHVTTLQKLASNAKDTAKTQDVNLARKLATLQKVLQTK